MQSSTETKTAKTPAVRGKTGRFAPKDATAKPEVKVFKDLAKADRDAAVAKILKKHPEFETKDVRDKLIALGYTEVEYRQVYHSMPA